MKKLTTEEFIEKAKEIHGDKYDYSKVEYKGAHTKVCIICPEHGEFWQAANSHINLKEGCPKCGRIISNSKQHKLGNFAFIEKARKVHGDKYDYSKVEYINNKTPVCIICPIHGEFWQVVSEHLKGCNCPKCAINNMINKLSLSITHFIERAKQIHGEIYDYSKAEYKSVRDKVCIICPEHGEFWQVANDHLRGCGCPKCRRSKLELEVYNFLTDNDIFFEEQKKFK